MLVLGLKQFHILFKASATKFISLFDVGFYLNLRVNSPADLTGFPPVKPQTT